MERILKIVTCRSLIIALLILSSNITIAQIKFFSPDNYVSSGIYYYPEHWDESEWEHDISKIAELGFEFVHMAEFSWAMLEPTEGQFNFAWLDKAISICEQNNLRVVLGTPTPAPPVWLTQKYPETMLVRSNGIRCEHGSRACYSWSSDKYHEFTKIIVSKMAERYGHNPNVIGWQVDNEPSHYSQVDYSPIMIPKFQQWLKEKYKTIDQLNKEWGSAMWSGTLSSFDQIRLPNPETHPNGVSSPTWQLDFRRFSANQFSNYMNMQAAILREHISPNQWITTNCTALFTETDNFRLEGYDFLSYTEYFARGQNVGLGEQGFRLGDYRETAVKSEYTKSYGGISGVMEIQPGQVNWADYNVQLYPGVLRASLWQCFALGESFVCSYRF
ncbi:MAG: beta-galactosidase, partial [Prolixibacteraceae bacterium]|nr:beta-galactosidase [Prolixibacteraceae bacterium]